MKKILRYAPIAMAMLLMASCASKKTITDGTKLPSLPHAQTEFCPKGASGRDSGARLGGIARF